MLRPDDLRGARDHGALLHRRGRPKSHSHVGGRIRSCAWGEAQSNDALVSAKQVFDSTEGGIDALLDPAHRVQGTGTGFYRYDEMTGGMRPGELIILAARPAMGKTALALNVALHVATNTRDPKGVAIFSLEMQKEALLTRLICSQGNVDQQKFRSGFLDDDEMSRLKNAAADIYSAPIYIDDSSNTSMMDIKR